MRLKQLLPILLLSGMCACASKTALNYNEKINDIEDSLKEDIKSTDDKVTKFFQQQQYDSAAIASERMEKLVDSKVKEIEAMPAPNVKEGENLKKAAIRYFAYMKKVYTSYKMFALDPTDEQRQNLVRISEDSRDALKDIQSAQQKYAEANGFKIENK